MVQLFLNPGKLGCRTMFPFRRATIFRSRYMAMLWAAGIIWLAYGVAGPADPSTAGGNRQAVDATGAPVTPQDIEALQSAINQI